ncbi:MAG TPA: zinc-binding alcohol dehydrogenase [Anaerolineales bacterium]|jgi:2-desacetyl-2-hydroxyethyl bacteriochlorophyllide A dehydrogenase|nr:zinc-binding alcohol dehydrogenase [Anaerolineales bacterium]
MKRRYLSFDAPRQISIREEQIPAPKPGQVQVQTVLSGISPGTEMLVYRGEILRDLPVDESISALSGEFAYPLQYGYSAVGRVVGTGAEVDPGWMGQEVFALQPHASHFNVRPQELQMLPQDLAMEDAVFLPNMETAVNLVMDGAPLIGEQVAVFGQGIVGLLTCALLARFPLAGLVTLDRYASRRELSLKLGAQASLDPDDPQVFEQVRAHLHDPGADPGADLIFELSGVPAALDQAIAVAGFSGRVVVGSWYGSKRADLDLGGHFHRARLHLVSSQVSTLAPELSGRWDKQRRFRVAWEALRQIRPARFITQRFPFGRATEAYQLLDQNPGEAIQVVLAY